MMLSRKNERLPIWVIILFCSLLVATNFLVQWQLHFYWFTVTVGLFVYPFLFLLTDFTSEIFGRKKSKQLVFIGLVFSIIPSIFISTFQIVAGSLLAYLAAQLFNIHNFLWIKEKTNNKYLWLRSSISNTIALLIDTVIFSTVAFYGVLDNKTILSIIYTEYPIKLIYAFFNVIPLYILIKLYKKMNANKEFIPYTWNQMDFLHRKIADAIKKDIFNPDYIVGISRCGLVPATHLAYLLEIDNVLTIKARTTSNDEILTIKDSEPIIELLFDSKCVFSSKVLLVDAVMASGTTFQLCVESLVKCNPQIIKTAVVIDWYNSPYKIRDNKTRPKIDYVGEIANKWPDFPWEH